MNVLVIGGTGSIGELVVAEALRKGHTVRALARDATRARRQLKGAEVIQGDLTQPDTITPAVDGMDAIVFTHGADGGKAVSEAVDYGGVRNALSALDGRTIRIALMSAIGVTDRTGSYNRSTQAHDWKRRGERLVRASGNPYTIVRPGWFDYNADDQHHLEFLQGDRRHAGDPSDGVVSRAQIAQVLVASLTSDAAQRKTLELVATKGAAQRDLEPLFAALESDVVGALDGVSDVANMDVIEEPQRVRDDLDRVTQRRGK
jgi:uncharacterized protein YbjT (DUF2867 family)